MGLEATVSICDETFPGQFPNNRDAFVRWRKNCQECNDIFNYAISSMAKEKQNMSQAEIMRLWDSEKERGINDMKSQYLSWGREKIYKYCTTYPDIIVKVWDRAKEFNSNGLELIRK